MLTCSFCGKSQKEVANLIAGPVATICNECVSLAMEIMDEEARSANPTVGEYLRQRFPGHTPETVSIRELVASRLQEVGLVPATAKDVLNLQIRRELPPGNS